ncbi:MAG TPA: hypothetical protein VLT33_09240, partial [Labilithrix sp.]|nr:hypothetical protein [Labilithrix sp.]
GLAFRVVLGSAVALGCSAPEETVGQTQSESTEASKYAPLLAARDATSRLEKALAQDSKLDGRLGVELATLRPLLTDAEVLSYQQEYGQLDAVAKNEREVNEAALDLRTKLAALLVDPALVMKGAQIPILAANGGALQSVVSYGPKQLYESYRLLARTGEGDAAAAFADHLLLHERALKAVWSKHDDGKILDELGRPGLLKAMVRALATLDASTKASPVDEVRTMIGGSSSVLGGVLVTMTALGDMDAKRIASEVGVKSAPLGIALAVWQLGRDANDARWKAVLTDLLAIPGATSATLEFAEAMNVISSSSRLFKAGQSIGKLAGGLGVLMQTVALIDSLDEWNDSPGKKIAIAGNAVAALGSILALCGVASVGPIGAVVAIAGGIVGPLMDKAREDGRQNKDKEAVLVAMGWSASRARNVARARGSFVRTLTSTLGFDRVAALGILDTVPEVAHGDLTDLALQGNAQGFQLDGLVTFQRIFGAGKGRGLVEAALGSATDAKRRTMTVEIVLAVTDCRAGFGGDPVFTTAMTPAQYRSQLPEIVKHVRGASGSQGDPALGAITSYVASLPAP